MKDYTRRLVDEKTVNTVKKLHKEAMASMITRQHSDIEKVQSKKINSLTKTNNTLKKDLDLEMRCKNQAYYFILNNGHFEDFREYSKKNAI